MKRILTIGLLLSVAFCLPAQTLSGDFKTGVIVDPLLWYRTGHSKPIATAVDVVVGLTVGEFNTVTASFDADVPVVKVHELYLATDWGAMGKLPIGLKSSVGFDDELVGVASVTVSPWIDITIACDWDPTRYQYKLTVAKSLTLIEKLLSGDLAVFYDTNGKDNWSGIIGLNGGIAITPGDAKLSYDGDFTFTTFGPAGWALENDFGIGYGNIIKLIAEANLNDIDGIAAINLELKSDPVPWGGIDVKAFMDPTEIKVLRCVDGSIYVKPDKVEWRVGYLWTFSGHVGLEYGPTLQDGGVYFVTTVEW